MAGSGSLNSTERLFFGEDYASLTNPIATNVFPGPGSRVRIQVGSPTFPNSNFPAPLPITGSDGEVALKIDHTGNSPYECIHLVAIAFSGNAQDQDGDGYLDVWEEMHRSSIRTVNCSRTCMPWGRGRTRRTS